MCLGLGSVGVLLEIGGTLADGLEPPTESFGHGLVEVGWHLPHAVGKDGAGKGGCRNDDESIVLRVVEGIVGLNCSVKLGRIASGTTHGLEFDGLTGFLAEECACDGLGIVERTVFGMEQSGCKNQDAEERFLIHRKTIFR